MAKINGLYYIGQQLGYQKLSLSAKLMRALTQGQPEEPLAGDFQRLGQLGLAISECDSLRRELHAMRELASHGLAGTVPDWYDGRADTDEWVAFDAYDELGFYLQMEGYHQYQVCQLSPLLLRLADELSSRARAYVLQFLNSAVPMMVYDEMTGDGRPLTRPELMQRSEEEMLSSMERTMFTQTYAQDLAQVRQLVMLRGDLQQVINLIGPLPEPLF